MHVSPGPWDSPAVIMRSAMGARLRAGRRDRRRARTLYPVWPPAAWSSVAPGGVQRDAITRRGDERQANGEYHVLELLELRGHRSGQNEM